MENSAVFFIFEVKKTISADKLMHRKLIQTTMQNIWSYLVRPLTGLPYSTGWSIAILFWVFFPTGDDALKCNTYCLLRCNWPDQGHCSHRHTSIADFISIRMWMNVSNQGKVLFIFLLIHSRLQGLFFFGTRHVCLWTVCQKEAKASSHRTLTQRSGVILQKLFSLKPKR